MKIKKKFILLSGLMLTTYAFAQAPIENLNDSANADTQQNLDNPQQTQAYQAYVANSSLTPEQRIARVEQQMANFSQMNLPQRIDALQQQVQQLQGQMEVQTHQMQLLQNQLQQVNQTQTTTSNSTTIANTPTTTAATSQTDEAAYQAAFNLLDNKKYNQAATALQQYTKTYPQGKYIANAHYWLGEIYYLQNNNDLAAKEFETIISQFPNDAKVPDSLLKLAFIDDHKGQHAQAKQQLKSIVKNYPGTTAAQLATIRLKSMS